jgi:hypothetical protein
VTQDLLIFEINNTLVTLCKRKLLWRADPDRAKRFVVTGKSLSSACNGLQSSFGRLRQRSRMRELALRLLEVTSNQI